MKKKYLSLLLLGFLLIGITTTITSCSDKDDEITYLISLNELPIDAQTFLNDYFPTVKASTVEKQSIGKVVMYKVNLDSGFEILFNSEGVWQEIEAPQGKSIPTGIVPQEIEEYVAKQYPDYGINEVNKTGNGYNVEINGGVRLTFNAAGECTGTFEDL